MSDLAPFEPDAIIFIAWKEVAMTDEALQERARAVIKAWDDQFDEDPSRSDPNAKPLEHFIAAAFAAVREECATVAESKAYTTDPYDPGYGYSCACKDVAKAIRTGP